MRMREKSGLAVFDIKPVDQTGKVDLVKIEGLKPEIDLRSGRTRFDLLGDSKSNLGETEQGPTFLEIQGRTLEAGTEIQGRPLGGGPEELVPHLVFGSFFPEPKTKEQLTRELEEELKKEQQIETVLANVGGEVFLPRSDLFVGQGRTLKNHSKFRRGVILKRKQEDSSALREFRQEQNVRTSDVSNKARPACRQAWPFWGPRSDLGNPMARVAVSPTGREIETRLEKSRSDLPAGRHGFFESSRFDLGRKVQRIFDVKSVNKILAYCLLLIALTFSGVFLWQSGFKLKNDVAEKGNQAVGNLEQAKAALGRFDFASAANNFSLAYENFSSASSNLNLLGSSISSFLGDLHGLGKLKSEEALEKFS